MALCYSHFYSAYNDLSKEDQEKHLARVEDEFRLLSRKKMEAINGTDTHQERLRQLGLRSDFPYVLFLPATDDKPEGIVFPEGNGIPGKVLQLTTSATITSQAKRLDKMITQEWGGTRHSGMSSKSGLSLKANYDVESSPCVYYLDGFNEDGTPGLDKKVLEKKRAQAKKRRQKKADEKKARKAKKAKENKKANKSSTKKKTSAPKKKTSATKKKSSAPKMMVEESSDEASFHSDDESSSDDEHSSYASSDDEDSSSDDEDSSSDYDE